MRLPFPIRATAAAVAFTLAFCHSAIGAESDHYPEDVTKPHMLTNPGSREAAPDVAPASDEAMQALKRMKLPPGFKVSLWAAEPMLANPVAFNFDERGRVFVSETHRYRTSVLDIRDYLWMLEDDLALRTIEDRSALIRKSFGIEGEKELSLESELIRLIEDRDGDGIADHSSVYATGFNSPLDGIASGVLARRDQVWFTNIPSLWRLTGRDKGEQRTELSRGYGVRFNYTGHDLHGLVLGPDGKIYFSCGDRGSHVPTKEGGLILAQDTGAVFRCNPDGSELELFASGLRNPQSLLFNEYGDLFTGDNDSDQGDEERLVHVVEASDGGWRIGYQFAPLGNAGPWNSEKMWHPRNPEQPAFLLPPICNIEDGPSGVAYNPGTALNAEYRNTIFITHFKGSISSSGIYSYKVEPDGASYRIVAAAPFLTSALPTDVKFGPDGRLYYSDWAEGWPKSARGRIYAIEESQSQDVTRKEIQRLIASDFTRKTPDELIRLLSHADWRVRLEAQYTLAEQGSASVKPLAKVAANTSANPLARRHAIWALGQLLRRDANVLSGLDALWSDADAEVRAQFCKIIGDARIKEASPRLIQALADKSARVTFFAAMALSRIGAPEAREALLDVARENDDRDAYLRHAVVVALASGQDAAALVAASTDASPAVRMASLLALRRLQDAQAARFLRDPAPAIAREAAVAINDAPIESAWGELARLIETPTPEVPVMLRVINANFRLGGADHARALAAYAVRDDAPAALRTEAVTQLGFWSKPPARDRIVGVFRPIAPGSHDAGEAARVLADSIGALLKAGVPEEVQIAAIESAEKLNAGSTVDALRHAVQDSSLAGTTRAAALNALGNFKAPALADAVKVASESDSPPLRLAALPIAARLSPDAAAPLVARLVESGTAEEQKAAFATLGKLEHPIVEPLLLEQLKKLEAGQVPAGVQLELIEAASQRSSPEIKAALARRDAKIASSGSDLAPFLFALEGGNKRRGQRIFYTQPVMACVRCHRAGPDGGDAGPNLTGIGARHSREYLLESVVKPSAKIAPGFDTAVVTLTSGASVGGIVDSETADDLSLRDAEGKVVRVPKATIAKRESVPSSMPDIYHSVLTKTELRDLVEFLATLTEAPKAKADHDQPRAMRQVR